MQGSATHDHSGLGPIKTKPEVKDDPTNIPDDGKKNPDSK